MKIHGYHRNVTGPYFQSLHTLFEGQYHGIWAALHEIAEHICALGVFTSTNRNNLAELSSIPSSEHTP